MPVGVHRFDNATNHELTTLATARGEQHMEVMFTVLPALKLVEHTVGEGAETLRTPMYVLQVDIHLVILIEIYLNLHKTLLMP